MQTEAREALYRPASGLDAFTIPSSSHDRFHLQSVARPDRSAAFPHRRVLNVPRQRLQDAKALTGDAFTHGHRTLDKALGDEVDYCAGALTERWRAAEAIRAKRCASHPTVPVEPIPRDMDPEELPAHATHMHPPHGGAPHGHACNGDLRAVGRMETETKKTPVAVICAACGFLQPPEAASCARCGVAGKRLVRENGRPVALVWTYKDGHTEQTPL